ncbi:MAG: exodeoxyribonuclease III [Elusimicrobia bacterium]|nr:exodeoxyribonuclease III [Elusimicrobiota bacterium]
MTHHQHWRLISWNVNGLRAVAKKGFPEWFSIEKPDILCLQETKAHPDQIPPEIKNFNGYESNFNWAVKKGYSGVATFAQSAPIKIESSIGNPSYDQEGRVLIHQYPLFTLFNVYFPNGKQSPERLAYKMSFYKDFLKLLNAYGKKGQKNFVICGDVNTAHKEIDLARPKENSKISGFLPQERAWIDELLANGYLDTFRVFEKGPNHYTWWDMQSRARERNVGWRIDYFFISATLEPNLKKASIMPHVMGSDHCPVSIELTF